MNIALITGINGQDGSYLAELLLEKNYTVWGLIRRSSNINTQRIDHIYEHPNLKLKYYDLSDSSNIVNIINEIYTTYKSIKVLEIYNLAAMSHVKVSFELPEYTADIDGVGVLRILEAIKNSPLKEKTRFYQASTSELYGKVVEVPQNENTPFYPRSPYGVAKLYGYWITKNYREAYNIFACNGILFNHESPLRGETFVTRKIVIGLCKIKLKKQKKLILGNLNAKRDWGHAKDYCEAMWKMLQQKKPDDYVIATGKTTSVRDFVNECCKYLNFKIKWIGTGVKEKAYLINGKKRELIIKVDKKYYRPLEIDYLKGDPRKAFKNLNYKLKHNLKDLVKDMIVSDIEHFQKNS